MYVLKQVIADLTKAIADIAQCENQLAEVVLAKSGINADLSWPSFPAAKSLGKPPQELAQLVCDKISLPETVKGAEVTGGYLNFHLNWPIVARAVVENLSSPEPYGHQVIGSGKVIVTDFSSPNIAKPFSVGHLRSTVIGDSINRHLKALGYTVIGDNHLGDWGTTFGKMIVAFRQWGNRKAIVKSNNPVAELTKLYVRFQETVNPNSGIAQEETIPADEDKLDETGDHPLMVKAREAALALENGSKEEKELWEWFVKLSLRTFEGIYKRLGVSFEEQLGESFYLGLIPETVDMLKQHGLLETEQKGAVIVPLHKMEVTDKHGNRFPTPLMVLKTNGGSVYETRDLACALYREKRWQPERIIYVVGSEQGPYFDKLFKTLELAGLEAELVHADFGLVLMKSPDGKWEKMSTRMGRVVLLEDLLDQAVSKAREILNNADRPSDLDDKEKDEVAHMIGIGAVKFNDLSQGRNKNIRFDLDNAVRLEGLSGPYLQYMAARVNSLLRKGKVTYPVDVTQFGDDEKPLLLLVAQFPIVVEKVAKTLEPHHTAQYLFNLAQAFSSYYDGVKILGAGTPEMKNSRLWLASAVGSVMKEGLNLLGIETPEKM